MIEDSIKNLKEQLAWVPEVQNASGLKSRGKIILCGMGGSRISSGFLKILRPDMDIQIWNDYGLPPNHGKDSLAIVSSYSGETEEAIDNFDAATESGMQIAVISSGGKLLSLAKESGVPYIEMPQGHAPRMTAGYHLKALITLLGENSMRDEINSFAEEFTPEGLEVIGKSMGDQISGIPLIYASNRNGYLSEYFKISFNETSKSQAFSNVMPELAHNEISSFSQATVDTVSFILIHDLDDHPRIQIKFDALESLLKEKRATLFNINLTGSVLNKIWSAYALANWSSLQLANKNGVNPEEQGVIEEFKESVQ